MRFVAVNYDEKKMSTRRGKKYAKNFYCKRAANKQKPVDINAECNDERKLACR